MQDVPTGSAGIHRLDVSDFMGLNEEDDTARSSTRAPSYAEKSNVPSTEDVYSFEPDSTSTADVTNMIVPARAREILAQKKKDEHQIAPSQSRG